VTRENYGFSAESRRSARSVDGVFCSTVSNYRHVIAATYSIVSHRLQRLVTYESAVLWIQICLSSFGLTSLLEIDARSRQSIANQGPANIEITLSQAPPVGRANDELAGKLRELIGGESRVQSLARTWIVPGDTVRVMQMQEEREREREGGDRYGARALPLSFSITESNGEGNRKLQENQEQGRARPREARNYPRYGRSSV